MLGSILRPLRRRRTGALRQALGRAEASGDPQAVIAAARTLAEHDRASDQAWLALGRALHKSEQHRPAVEAYRRALACGAPAPEAHKQLGVLHAALGEIHPALDHLSRAVELTPEDADTICMLGCVLNDARRVPQALAQFERALALREDFPEAHYNLGLARFERGDLPGALESIERCAALNRGRWPADPAAALASDPAPPFAARDMGVNDTKLEHDCEQLEYLLDHGRLPAAYREVLAQYRALRAALGGQVEPERVVPFDAARYPLVARTYKRPLHLPREAPPPGPLIDPALDCGAIEERYLAAQPNVVTLDGLVTPAALQALRRFCLEATVWNNINVGYLGAFMHDGFCSELLLRLAWELRERLPRVVRGLPLQTLWGFKCDSRMPGLGVHADAAAVNVNFWITDERANLDAEGGGLLIYEHQAPLDWGFLKYNNDAQSILAYLDSLGSRTQRVAYRANRAVIFDSDLFHASDRPRFREGYAERRVNITLLYGRREA